MILVRYETVAGIFHGEIEGDTVHRLSGDFFTGRTRTGDRDPLASARLLHPTLPTKIVNMAVNYPSHAGGRPLNVRPHRCESRLQSPPRYRCLIESPLTTDRIRLQRSAPTSPSCG